MPQNLQKIILGHFQGVFVDNQLVVSKVMPQPYPFMPRLCPTMPHRAPFSVGSLQLNNPGFWLPVLRISHIRVLWRICISAYFGLKVGQVSEVCKMKLHDKVLFAL